MPTAKTWLEKLTLDKLHRLATSIGAPCSGTKAARIDGIRRAISDIRAGHEDGRQTGQLSLLSIDMGIRNLAFAHIKAPLEGPSNSRGLPYYKTPILQAWQRSSVSTEADEVSAIVKESFEPVDYAKHAYKLIKDLLELYQPNKILIERQRFRSGGGSAVQEWTIRVGVFEAMLYSVLRTLIEEHKMDLSVEPMQPPRVNRFWLESQGGGPMAPVKKLTGREVKAAKVELVAVMLKNSGPTISFTQDLQPFVADFISSSERSSTPRRTAREKIGKLDDLADSLLQGMAYIEWQNNRARISALGQDAVDPETGALSSR